MSKIVYITRIALLEHDDLQARSALARLEYLLWSSLFGALVCSCGILTSLSVLSDVPLWFDAAATLICTFSLCGFGWTVVRVFRYENP